MKPVLLSLFLGLSSPLSHACLWDRDTIASEKARFPGVAETLFGYFPRHSKEFYEWRKKTSEEIIAADPSRLEAYDDLAVAQHKLGDHRAAIETMKKKDAVKPGLYETLSNTGTFLIYTGDLRGALEQIDKALAVNPDAHFGREKYQKWLIEWVMAEYPGDIGISDNPTNMQAVGFAQFVLGKQAGSPDAMDENLRREAIRAVSGMMRFADFDNPLLQEAMGDVLASGAGEDNATRHASYAYLHALSRTTDLSGQQRLARKFQQAVAGLEDGKDPKQFQKKLQEGLSNGRKFAQTVKEDELKWIAAGKDASAEFEKKYLKPAN